MPNLKDLKVRINSVKSTQKITKAMKMVSASKLRRAREHAEAATPYAERMLRMLQTLSTCVESESAPKLLVGNGNDKTHLLVVVSSDRGLCGGFNTNLVKYVKQHASALSAEKKQYKILCIGKKAYEQMKLPFEGKIVGRVEGISKKKFIPFSDAKAQADRVIKMFENEEFDVCTIFFNQFVSAISQKPTKKQIIPLEIEAEESAPTAEELSAVYEFEPHESTILDELLPKNLSVQFYYSILESSAGEHAARMTAMDNATRNASDMIKNLTLTYNRLRQAAITKELIEIISGAEAI